MLAQWRRAAALHLTILRANDACDRPGQRTPNSPQPHLWLSDAHSLPATPHFPARSVQAAKNNPETRNPFFHSANALRRTSCPYKARVLRISPFLIPDVPAQPTCKAESSCPRRTRRKEKPFRCGRCPLRYRARLQFVAHPFETTYKYRGQSVAAAARASISRDSVPMQERDGMCCSRNRRNKKPPSKNSSRRL